MHFFLKKKKLDLFTSSQLNISNDYNNPENKAFS